MCPYRSLSSPAAENSIDALALRNCSICSIVPSRSSFMWITILGMINPLLLRLQFLSLQAHSSVEIRPSFRLIPHWTSPSTLQPIGDVCSLSSVLPHRCLAGWDVATNKLGDFYD